MKIRTWIWKKVVRRSSVRRRRSSIRHAIFVRNSKVEYEKHKESAVDLVTRKIINFNTFYHFNLGRITVRNQRSRWGSCSKRGNLNFNYRLALIPDVLVDYVIVHELCHLVEFNHSKDFWNLVAQTIPNYAQLRKQLHKIKF